VKYANTYRHITSVTFRNAAHIYWKKHLHIIIDSYDNKVCFAYSKEHRIMAKMKATDMEGDPEERQPLK